MRDLLFWLLIAFAGGLAQWRIDRAQRRASVLAVNTALHERDAAQGRCDHWAARADELRAHNLALAAELASIHAAKSAAGKKGAETRRAKRAVLE